VFESRIGETLLHALTEIGNGIGQAGQFFLPIGLSRERVRLIVQAGNPLL